MIAMHVVHNLLGHPKRFRMIDGMWEDDAAAKAWMKDKSDPAVEKAAAKVKAKEDKKAKLIADWEVQKAKYAAENTTV